MKTRAVKILICGRDCAMCDRVCISRQEPRSMSAIGGLQIRVGRRPVIHGIWADQRSPKKSREKGRHLRSR
jgi:hypothetical protein